VTATSSFCAGVRSEGIGKEAEKEEVAVTFASLILHDDEIPITADKLNALLKSANVTVQPYLPNFFARVLAKKNIDDFLLGAGGFAAGPSTATSAAAGNTSTATQAEESKTAAPEAKKEEEKKKPAKEEEEEDDDMGFGLFD